MKKIIYSLVIMIAAGSLFTSCVENTEPQGIKDLRLAKADYLDALSNLRAADAEKVKAEATLVQAQAAVQQAVAAKVQAAAKLAEAQAKAQEITNDKTAADNAIALEKAKAEAEVYLVKQEKLLAEAEEALRAYLVQVEEQSKQLTWAEQQIVWAYTAAYNKVIAKQKAVREAEEDLYDATYNDYGVNKVEAAIAAKESEIARAEASINRAIAKYDEYEKKAEEEIAKYDVWAAEYQKLQDSVEAYEYVKADLKKAAEIAKIEDKEAFDAFYKELEDAQDAVQKAVTAAGNGFSLDKSYTLPTTGKSVVETFAKYVNTAGFSEVASFKVEGGKLVVKATDKDATAKNIFGDEKNPDNASLAGIIDALKRDSIVVDKIINDTTGLSAAVAKVKAEYAAVKDTLEKGVAAYEPIAKAQAKVDSLEKVAHEVDSLFVNDTVALLASIRTFLAAENANAKYTELRREDSVKVWNAFIDIMKYREKVFDLEGADTAKLYYTYYVNTADAATETYIPKEKTVKFSELTFDGVVRDAKDKSLYGGYKKDGKIAYGQGVFNMIVTKAVGGDFYSRTYTDNAFKSEATFAQLSAATNHLQDLFFGKYWLNDAYSGTNWGKIYKGSDVYVSDAVVKANEAKDKAGEGIPAAKENFYKKIYCKFWGLEENGDAPSDSLKINYSEKTYTDPYVIPVFSAKDEGAPIFTPAKGQKAADFVWNNLTYNNDDTELKLIKEKLGQDNIRIENGSNTFTLYAKSLAVEQIAGLVEDYKENTKALAALEKVVASVEEYYATTLLKIADATAVADSVVTAYLGENVVKAALAGDYKALKTASNLWKNPGAKAKLVVNYTAKNIDGFCEEGEYTFGGLQLAAAEKWIPDYAKDVYSHHIVMESIKAAQEDCQALSNIINEYAKEIAKLDKNYRWGSAADIDAAVVAKWNWFLGNIESEINNLADQKAKAEAVLAKIEAGYSTEQAKIDSAKDALAKAEQALEQAEVEFAVAEAAYEAVLANHGITE